MANDRRAVRVNRMRGMGPEVSRAYARAMGAVPMQYEVHARSVVRFAPSAHAVLDVGTGPGFFLPLLARAYPSARLTGLDLGGEMCRIARTRVEMEGLEHRVTVVCGSAYDMPFPDASFDLVVATQFAHMLDDLVPFLRESRRVLRPGGRLVVLDERRDMAWPLYAAMWATSWTFRLLRMPLDGMGPVVDACYTAEEMERALRDAGFPVVGVRAGAVQLQAWARTEVDDDILPG